MENATYSILSPEGFASILWKDSKRAKRRRQMVMKVTAKTCRKLGIIEQVISEEIPACRKIYGEIARRNEERMKQFLEKYKCHDTEELAQQRYERFRRM